MLSHQAPYGTTIRRKILGANFTESYFLFVRIKIVSKTITGFLLSGAFCLGNGVLDIKQLPPVDLETTSDAIVLAIAAVGGLAFMLRTGVLE
jgi:hypothetical protein